MGNNPGYAKGRGQHEHEKQETARERKQRRRDVAAGSAEPQKRQRWDDERKCWVRVP